MLKTTMLLVAYSELSHFGSSLFDSCGSYPLLLLTVHHFEGCPRHFTSTGCCGGNLRLHGLYIFSAGQPFNKSGFYPSQASTNSLGMEGLGGLGGKS